MVGHGSSDNAASFGVYAFGLLPGLTAVRDSISLHRLLRREDRPRRFDGRCAVAVGTDARRARVRRRGHGAAGRSRSRSPTSPTPSSRTRPRRCSRSRPAPSSRSPRRRRTRTSWPRSPCSRRSLAGRCDEVAGLLGEVADQLEEQLPELERLARSICRPVRVGLADVRDRPRARVRDRARDRAEAARDLPDRRRAADRDRSRPRPGRRARSAVPGLVDRDRGRDPRRGRRRDGARTRGGSDRGRERHRRRGARRRAVPRCRCPSRGEPLLSPLLSVVPGQLFAGAVARAKGLDPDKPRGLSKVTLAR